MLRYFLIKRIEYLIYIFLKICIIIILDETKFFEILKRDTNKKNWDISILNNIYFIISMMKYK